MRMNNRLEDVQHQDIEEETRTIYAELGELAKYVEATTRAVKEIEAPVSTTAHQIPQAASFLSDLSRMTEEGAHRVMGLVEELEKNRCQVKHAIGEIQTLLAQETNHAVASSKLTDVLSWLDQDESRLMDINIALSFQDLVAQRVKKLVCILDDVQHKLLKLVVVFGLQMENLTPNHDERGSKMLEQLQQARSSSLDQHLVDEILGEFGFQ